MPQLSRGDLASTDDASYTNWAGATVWPFPLGSVYGPDTYGREHRYYRVLDTGGGGPTNAAGIPVGFDLASSSETNMWTVDADLSDTVAAQVAGLERNAVTDGRAAWIHTVGQSLDAVTTDGNVVEGSLCVWSADSTIAPFTDPGNEETIFTLARNADSSTTQAAGDLILLRRLP